MGQDVHKIARMYDAIAADWAAAFTGEHDKKPMDREMLARFAAEVGERRPVWDLGCGPGNTARWLSDLGICVSGLDLSGGILAQARLAHPDIAFRQGDMLALDFTDDSVAGITAFYAIVHFMEAQVATFVREVFRVLQPGGVLLLTCHVGEETIHLDHFLGREVDIDVVFFSTGFISRSLADSGFTRIEIVEREPYAGIEYPSHRAYVFARKPAAALQPRPDKR